MPQPHVDPTAVRMRQEVPGGSGTGRSPRARGSVTPSLGGSLENPTRHVARREVGSEVGDFMSPGFPQHYSDRYLIWAQSYGSFIHRSRPDARWPISAAALYGALWSATTTQIIREGWAFLAENSASADHELEEGGRDSCANVSHSYTRHFDTIALALMVLPVTNSNAEAAWASASYAGSAGMGGNDKCEKNRYSANSRLSTAIGTECCAEESRTAVKVP
ncbi:hypothetical protein DFH09DRAFT_1094044 [Mycena vulgaris]|nr:hypothetical protein DFH09DRAFT_1094044 [Mycena vulgaris]